MVSVEELDEYEDEYVYDIGMASDRPYFFANDILVHNSVYFSVDKLLKSKEKSENFTQEELEEMMSSKENIVQFYDAISDQVNDTFPEFMYRTFNTTLERGSIIKAGRELVGSTGLFIKKKKYAILVYEKDGKRLDTKSQGELKVMGLDLKRSDTPKIMQEFLQSLLMNVLVNKKLEDMYRDIKDFRQKFVGRFGWEKGSPKRVNNFSKFVALVNNSNKVGINSKAGKSKVNMPGHVRASINWNTLCDINDDKYSQKITDSSRVIVCKLKSNSFGFDSIAFPVDEPHLPKWFKELPFDDLAMEETIIDKKITNLVGVLKWDLSKTKINIADDLFSFDGVSQTKTNEDDEDEDEDDEDDI